MAGFCFSDNATCAPPFGFSRADYNTQAYKLLPVPRQTPNKDAAAYKIFYKPSGPAGDIGAANPMAGPPAPLQITTEPDAEPAGAKGGFPLRSIHLEYFVFLRSITSKASANPKQE